MSCVGLTPEQCWQKLLNDAYVLNNICLSQNTKNQVIYDLLSGMIDSVYGANSLIYTVPDCTGFANASSGFMAAWLASNRGGFTSRPTCQACRTMILYNTQTGIMYTFMNCVDDGNGYYELSNLDPTNDVNWTRSYRETGSSYDAQLWGWEASYLRAGQPYESYSNAVTNAMRFANPVIRDAGLTGLLTYDGTAGSIVLPVGSYQLQSTVAGYVRYTASGANGNTNHYVQGWHDIFTSTSIYLQRGTGTTPTQRALGKLVSLLYLDTGILSFTVTGTSMTIYPRILHATYEELNGNYVAASSVFDIYPFNMVGSIKINKVG